MLALPVLANPSWGVGGCYAPAQGLVRPAGRPIAQAPLPLRWITDARTPGQANLYLGTRQIGAWNHARQKYAPLTAAGWGPEQDVPPLANPPGCPRCADPSGECTCPPDNCGCPDCPISQAIKAPVSGQLKLWQIDGVDAHKIDGRAVDSHKVNGCKVPKAEAMAAIGRGELADDSGKLWVVCSHPDPAVRKKFADDYQSSPDLADLRTHAHLWAGPGAAPTSYLAKDRESKPLWAEGVSLLDPTGGELWHEAGYTPATLDNLRKADPHYTPDRSPGPHHPKKDDAAADDDYTLLLVAGAALALIFFLFGRPTHAA
jgi:hypothetical protein